MTSVKNLMQNISFMIPQTNKRVIFGEDKFSSLLHSSAVGGKSDKTTVLPGFTKTESGGGRGGAASDRLKNKKIMKTLLDQILKNHSAL